MLRIVVITLFITTGIFSCVEIFSKKGCVYTIHKFVFLYALIFWSIVPLFQYLSSVFPWGIVIIDEDALIANVFILLFLLTYNVAYKYFNKYAYKHKYIEFPIEKFGINNTGIFVLLIFQLFIFMFFYIQAGGIRLLRGESPGIISDYQSIRLIVGNVFRSFTTFSAILVLLNYKNKKTMTKLFYLLISLFLMILTNFPFAIARYAAGAFYIGLIFIIKPHFKNRALPYLGLVLLFLFIYPATSYFRNIETFSSHDIDIMNTYLFFSGDFDNFSTLNMTISHVRNYGITDGRQLLGVLLFFIPRSFWPNKPIGSGAYVAEARNWNFTNISSPIIAEGYINFGILGIIIFAIILAYIVAKMDYKFYKYGKLNIYKLFYPVALGFIFFILRGDQMSSFAFLAAYIISAILNIVIIKKFLVYK